LLLVFAVILTGLCQTPVPVAPAVASPAKPASVPVTAAARATSARLAAQGKFTDLRPARVGPQGAALYTAAKAGCPQDESCKLSDDLALKPGQIVFVHPDRDGFTPLGLRLSDNLAPTAALELAPFDRHPSAAGWVGGWRADNGTIRISESAGGGLAIRGSAVWKSNNIEHVGDFQATVPIPKDHLLILHDEHNAACEVSLALFGATLIAEDNEGCGAANVRFWGEYTRASAQNSAAGKAAATTPSASTESTPETR
jgi:hypothetical protein